MEIEKGTGISFHMPNDRLLESIHTLLWTCSLIMEGTLWSPQCPAGHTGAWWSPVPSYAVRSGVAAHVCVPWHLKGAGLGRGNRGCDSEAIGHRGMVGLRKQHTKEWAGRCQRFYRGRLWIGQIPGTGIQVGWDKISWQGNKRSLFLHSYIKFIIYIFWKLY